MKSKLLLFLLLSSLSGESFAQHVIGDYSYSCPVGANWNDPRCVRGVITGDQGEAQGPQPPSRFESSLPLMWGAIAIDPAKQVAGFSADKKSHRQAEKAALKDCKAKGGDGCDIAMTYFDKCVGMAVGENAKFGIVKAETEGKALYLAMEACEEQGAKCEIYYAGCSFPK